MLIAIAHWMRVLGPHNILIVQTESLHLSMENIAAKNLSASIPVKEKKLIVKSAVQAQLARVYRHDSSPLPSPIFLYELEY
jgi:hypothetical protein